MNNPNILIVIPSYNHSRFLPQLFESICNQTYTNLSVLFSDDCSPDNNATLEVVNKWKPLLEKNIQGNVCTIFQDKNLGPWENFIFLQKVIKNNSGLGSTFIQYVESDDWFYTTKFEKQIEFFTENPTYSMCHTDATEVIEVDGIETKIPGFWKQYRKAQPGGEEGIPTGNIREKLMMCNFIFTCTALCRTEDHIKYYDYDLFYNQYKLFFGDMAFFLNLSKDKLIGYLDIPLSYYRNLSNSLSHNSTTRNKMIESTFRIQQMAREGII